MKIGNICHTYNFNYNMQNKPTCPEQKIANARENYPMYNPITTFMALKSLETNEAFSYIKDEKAFIKAENQTFFKLGIKDDNGNEIKEMEFSISLKDKLRKNPAVLAQLFKNTNPKGEYPQEYLNSRELRLLLKSFAKQKNVLKDVLNHRDDEGQFQLLKEEMLASTSFASLELILSTFANEPDLLKEAVLNDTLLAGLKEQSRSLSIDKKVDFLICLVIRTIGDDDEFFNYAFLKTDENGLSNFSKYSLKNQKTILKCYKNDFARLIKLLSLKSKSGTNILNDLPAVFTKEVLDFMQDDEQTLANVLLMKDDEGRHFTWNESKSYIKRYYVFNKVAELMQSNGIDDCTKNNLKNLDKTIRCNIEKREDNCAKLNDIEKVRHTSDADDERVKYLREKYLTVTNLGATKFHMIMASKSLSARFVEILKDFEGNGDLLREAFFAQDSLGNNSLHLIQSVKNIKILNSIFAGHDEELCRLYLTKNKAGEYPIAKNPNPSRTNVLVERANILANRLPLQASALLAVYKN